MRFCRLSSAVILEASGDHALEIEGVGFSV